MRTVLIAAILVICLIAQAAAQNAGATWNQFASTYHFDAYPQDSGVTFFSAYNGGILTFNSDFMAIKAAVSGALGVTYPDIDGDDLLNQSVESWPDI